MDVEILARVQFALTIMFHYIYPPLSIGLSLLIVIVEGAYLKTGNERYLRSAKYWTKIFALTFAIGVATGIVMEFEFGTNWAAYSRYVGDVFGSALAAEGVFAFFLESGFLAILLFGWNRVSSKMHFFASLMVCLGAHFSAIWIVVANSWMQTPAGFRVVGEGMEAHAEITNFWEMVFNPSAMVRLGHTIVGAWLAGAFLAISIASFYLLKNRNQLFALSTLKIGFLVAFVSCIIQGILGSMSADIVTEYQPAKLASLEGIYHTQSGVPFYILGIPNSQEEKVQYAIKIPKLLSFLAHWDIDAEVKGLDQFPKKDWPHVQTLFFSYRIMIGSWILMTLLSIIGMIKFCRGTLDQMTAPVLSILMISVILPQIANQVGWLCAEMGRYPWIVQDQLRISQGLSEAVTAGHVLGSIILFGVVYLFLFALFIYLLNYKIQQGPTQGEEDMLYHGLSKVVKT